MKQWHWFQWILVSTTTLFLGIIVYVITIAYSRTSGSTGLDMPTIQKIRYDAFTKPQPP